LAQPNGGQQNTIERITQFTFHGGEITPSYYEGDAREGQVGLKDINNFLISAQGDLIKRDGAKIIGSYYNTGITDVDKQDLYLLTGVDNIDNVNDSDYGFTREIPIGIIQVNATQQKCVNLLTGQASAAFPRVIPVGGKNLVSFNVTYHETVVVGPPKQVKARTGVAIVGSVSQAGINSAIGQERRIGAYFVIKDGLPTAFEYFQYNFNSFYNETVDPLDSSSFTIKKSSMVAMTEPICAMEFMKRATIVSANDKTRIFFSSMQVAEDHFIPTVGNSNPLKTACKYATSEHIPLLGLGVISGVTLGAGDRVLVRKQNDGKTNGIYTASATAWALVAETWATGDKVKTTDGTYRDITWTLTSEKIGATYAKDFQNFTGLEDRFIKDEIKGKQPHELFGCPTTDPYKSAITGFFEAMVSGEQIKWIASHKGIVIGTDKRIGYVAGTENYVAPGSALYLFQPLADIPSALNGVVRVQDTLFFLRSDNNNLHRLVWVEENQTYEARSVTAHAETKIRNVKKMVKIEHPYPIIFALNETLDGSSVVSLLHVKGTSVTVSHFSFSDEILDIATYAVGSKSYLVIKTPATGAGDSTLGYTVSQIEIRSPYDASVNSIRMDFAIEAPTEIVDAETYVVGRMNESYGTLVNGEYYDSATDIGKVMFINQKKFKSFQSRLVVGSIHAVTTDAVNNFIAIEAPSSAFISVGVNGVEKAFFGETYDSMIETAPLWSYIGLVQRQIDCNVLIARGADIYTIADSGQKYSVVTGFDISFGQTEETQWQAKSHTIGQYSMNGTIKIGNESASPLVLAGIRMRVTMTDL